jgi:CHASE2 domain-containing sensor protein
VKNKSLWFDSILVTACVFALIGIIKFNPINFHVFDLKESWKDLELTDLYFSKIKSKDVRDTSIVIVDIDMLGREALANILMKVSDGNPSVVAVDAYFLEPKNSSEDSLLIHAFKQLGDKLVLAGFFEQQDDSNDGHAADEKWVQTHPMFGEFTVGHINLAGDHHSNATIRYFRPAIDDKEALSVQVARKYDSKKAEELMAREKSIETINYLGGHDQFFHLTADELFSGNSMNLKGKIVLLGYAGEVSAKKFLEDAHFTPLNEELGGRSFPDTYGVVIHANIISMILRGDYINKVSTFWNFIIALIIGLAHVAAYLYFYVHKHKWFHLFAKISQLITSIVLMFFVIGILGAWNIKFDPALTLVVILLSVDVLYFYEPVALYMKHKIKYPSFFPDHH